VARWQDRLTPLQRRVAGGCHLNRRIDDLIAHSGLELSRMTTYYAKGPRPFGYMFEGVATKNGPLSRSAGESPHDHLVEPDTR
jgi:hypothetical protein